MIITCDSPLIKMYIFLRINIVSDEYNHNLANPSKQTEISLCFVRLNTCKLDLGLAVLDAMYVVFGYPLASV